VVVMVVGVVVVVRVLAGAVVVALHAAEVHRQCKLEQPAQGAADAAGCQQAGMQVQRSDHVMAAGCCQTGGSRWRQVEASRWRQPHADGRNIEDWPGSGLRQRLHTHTLPAQHSIRRSTVAPCEQQVWQHSAEAQDPTQQAATHILFHLVPCTGAPCSVPSRCLLHSADSGSQQRSSASMPVSANSLVAASAALLGSSTVPLVACCSNQLQYSSSRAARRASSEMRLE
jgi:hypothetical protein